MITLHKLNANYDFPPAEDALSEPNGLLAFGGDLSIGRLVEAYSNGIFPWFSEGEPILWWTPDPRGVIFTDDYSSSKSLLKHIRRHTPRVTINHSFNMVISACATVPRSDNGTWITTQMINAYIQLHQAGFAHSIEVWQDEQLVGGLYGVFIDSVFCGESMFSHTSNGSKVAFHYLVEHLRKFEIKLIDCQMQNPHLKTLGCQSVSRSEFLALLENLAKTNPFDSETPIWNAQEITTNL